MRRFAAVSTLFMLMAALMACGENTFDSDFTTGNLNGTWLFQTGTPLVDSGDLTFDSGGNLIEVTPPPDSNAVITAFAGKLSVNDTGQVTGTLSIISLVTSEGSEDQTVNEELQFDGYVVRNNLITGLVIDRMASDPQNVSFSLSN